jgi:hypothetical protein
MCGNALQCHLKELCIVGCQADPDVVQGLPRGKLRKCHDTEQVGAIQRANTGIALVPIANPPERFPWYVRQKLGESALHTRTCPLGLFRPESIARDKNDFKIVDTRKNRETLHQYSPNSA